MRLKQQPSSGLEPINANVAGIDIGAQTHWVCVPAERAVENVRSFGCFTADLYALADWLQECGVQSVAMESTGVYWIPLFQILEPRGFEVKFSQCTSRQNSTGSQKRCAGLSMAPAITQLQVALGFFSSR